MHGSNPVFIREYILEFQEKRIHENGLSSYKEIWSFTM